MRKVRIDDSEVPASACTNCGMLSDHAIGVSTDPDRERVVPQPGNFTICRQCGQLMVFDDDLMLRNPTDVEMHDIAGNELLLTLQRLRLMR